ncbi:hypothetical protein KTR10_01385 [Candidatus Kaiserbacteria bacterium]|nr:hypothetical protein [Candidatus Kaiserbacteria bacterium]
MEDKIKDITLSTSERLIADEYYYKYVFKKTEKIICAVFYVLNVDVKDKNKSPVIKDTEESALVILRTATSSLRADQTEVRSVVETLLFDLVALESRLRALHAAQLLREEHLNVFLAEIDALVRSSKGFRNKQKKPTLLAPQKQSKSTVPKEVVKRASTTETKEARRSQILNVLKAQPGASMKDIQDTVTEYGAKTIQRELNLLIEEGKVAREGSKRWSTYSLA